MQHNCIQIFFAKCDLSKNNEAWNWYSLRLWIQKIMTYNWVSIICICDGSDVSLFDDSHTSICSFVVLRHALLVLDHILTVHYYFLVLPKSLQCQTHYRFFIKKSNGKQFNLKIKFLICKWCSTRQFFWFNPFFDLYQWFEFTAYSKTFKNWNIKHYWVFVPKWDSASFLFNIFEICDLTSRLIVSGVAHVSAPKWT